MEAVINDDADGSKFYVFDKMSWRMFTKLG